MRTNFTQRFTNKKPTYRPVGETIDPRAFDVSEITETAARIFILEHHYSGSFPASRRRFGLFKNGELVGVAVFSHPCNEKTITNVFGCEKAADGLELGRFVLIDSVPSNGESWFLARCRAILKNDFVGFVSFSDDFPRLDDQGLTIFAGHIGTIYQASNAAFLGRGTSRYIRLLADGKVFSDRALQKIRKMESGANYAIEILRSFGLLGDVPKED